MLRLKMLFGNLSHILKALKNGPQQGIPKSSTELSKRFKPWLGQHLTINEYSPVNSISNRRDGCKRNEREKKPKNLPIGNVVNVRPFTGSLG